MAGSPFNVQGNRPVAPQQGPTGVSNARALTKTASPTRLIAGAALQNRENAVRGYLDVMKNDRAALFSNLDRFVPRAQAGTVRDLFNPGSPLHELAREVGAKPAGGRLGESDVRKASELNLAVHAFRDMKEAVAQLNKFPAPGPQTQRYAAALEQTAAKLEKNAEVIARAAPDSAAAQLGATMRALALTCVRDAKEARRLEASVNDLSQQAIELDVQLRDVNARLRDIGPLGGSAPNAALATVVQDADRLVNDIRNTNLLSDAKLRLEARREEVQSKIDALVPEWAEATNRKIDAGAMVPRGAAAMATTRSAVDFGMAQAAAEELLDAQIAELRNTALSGANAATIQQSIAKLDQAKATLKAMSKAADQRADQAATASRPDAARQAKKARELQEMMAGTSSVAKKPGLFFMPSYWKARAKINAAKEAGRDGAPLPADRALNSREALAAWLRGTLEGAGVPADRLPSRRAIYHQLGTS